MSRFQELEYVTDLVCSVLGVSRDELMSNRRTEDIVDAKTILCHVLDYQGVSTKIISDWVGIAPRSVNWHLCRYNDRINTNVWFSNTVQWIAEKSIETASGFNLRISNSTGTLRNKLRHN